MLQDLKYGLRVLSHAPGVTVTALITLAFGIGANSAIFSLMDAVVLRPLPYPEAGRLVMVFATDGRSHRAMRASWPMFRDWQDHSRAFDHLAAFHSGAVNLTGGGDPLRVPVAYVTADFFSVLSVPPAVGAGLDGRNRTAVLAGGFWMRRFGGDPTVVGRAVVLDGEAYTVAGVLPRSVRFPKRGYMDEPEIYLPLVPNPERRSHYLDGIGRLKPGVTLAQAQADLDSVSAGIEQADPRHNRGEGARATPLRATLVGDSGETLRIFLSAVGFVLLIACANVANLLLGQAARRQREVAIRFALGAGRARLIRQFLVESLLLSFGGAALGLLLAYWTLPLLAASVPAHTAFANRLAANRIQLNAPVLGFTLSLSLLSAVIFGLIPALVSSGHSTLNARSTRAGRLSGFLIAAEVALSLVLLSGAGVALKSFLHLMSVDPGFRTENLLAIDLELPEPKYSEPEKRADLVRQVLERVESLPGVQAAAAVNVLPLSKSSVTNSFSLAGSAEEKGSAGFRAVSPGYFHALGIPLLRGRLFGARESSGVAVINSAMAKRYWPGADPIGTIIEAPQVLRVRTARGIETRFVPLQFEIVGIVGDVRYLSLDYAPQPEMFMPYAQMATRDVTLALRSQGDLASLTRAVRNEIWAVDRDQPLADVRTMDRLIAEDVAPRRFVLLLLAVFAAIALALAAAGIFGVVRHSVSRRTREIGIRLALGAQAAGVVRLIVRQSLAWVSIGLAAGLAGAMALGRLLTAYLYEVKPRDPAMLASAAVLLGLVALAAGYLPASGAAKIDPAVTLRHE